MVILQKPELRISISYNDNINTDLEKHIYNTICFIIYLVQIKNLQNIIMYFKETAPDDYVLSKRPGF